MLESSVEPCDNSQGFLLCFVVVAEYGIIKTKLFRNDATKQNDFRLIRLQFGKEYFGDIWNQTIGLVLLS